VKIVFIIDSLRHNGTQRFLTHLAGGLHDLEYNQDVIVLNVASDPDIEDLLTQSGCAITFIGKRSLLLAGVGWWRLVANLREIKADVVVTLLDFADTLGRPAARLAGARAIVTALRARNLAKPSWQRWIDRKTVAWADKVILNSKEVVSYAREKEGVRENQVVVIPNGVDDLRARSGALRDEYRQSLSLPPATVLLGWVGRLVRQKNFPLFLRACAALSTKRDWKILVVGDGPEHERMQSLAHDVDLADRLIWLGSRGDVEAWLAAMDVFVHTADFEGMPNAVMEAMAMGLPVVVSDVDGNRELIRNGVDGYLVPCGDAVAFAKRIDEIIDNPDLARRLGEQAHRDVLERFDLHRMIQSYHSLFVSLVRSKLA
jgi:glycosyltransferase involved in cell wall biosynthesis